MYILTHSHALWFSLFIPTKRKQEIFLDKRAKLRQSLESIHGLFPILLGVDLTEAQPSPTAGPVGGSSYGAAHNLSRGRRGGKLWSQAQPHTSHCVIRGLARHP